MAVTIAGAIIGGLISGAGVTSLAFWSAAITGASLASNFDPYFKPEDKTLPTPNNIDNSPTYGWDDIKNISTQGFPVPIIYGRIKTGGNIISLCNRTIPEEDDSVLSIALALCEGEIKSIESIEINDLSLDYFDNIEIQKKFGSPNQEEIIIIGDFKYYIFHKVKDSIAYNSSISRDLINEEDGGYNILYEIKEKNIYIILVNFLINGLYSVDANNGTIHNYTVEIEIDVTRDEISVLPEPIQFSYTDKTQSVLRKTYIIRLPDGLDNFDDCLVKIKRITPEDNFYHHSSTKITTISELKPATLSYPNTAILNLQIKASEQLSSGIPEIKSIVNGIKANHLGLASPDYFRNPANIIYDILINKRYGAGNYITEDNIDIDSFIEVASYCEENNLYCNIIFDTFESAQQMIDEVCQTCGAFFIIQNDTLKLMIDKPEPIVQHFDESIIKEGTLNIKSIVKSDMPNTIEVQFMNEEKDFEKDYIKIREAHTIQNVEKKKTISLKGVTNKTQAQQFAERELAYMKYSDYIVTFQTDFGSIGTEIGSIVSFTFPRYQWFYKTFRLVSLTLTENFECHDVVLMPYDNRIYNEFKYYSNLIIDGGLFNEQDRNYGYILDGGLFTDQDENYEYILDGGLFTDQVEDYESEVDYEIF